MPLAHCYSKTADGENKMLVVHLSGPQAEEVFAFKELKKICVKIFPRIGMKVGNPEMEALADSKINMYRAALDKWT